VGDGANRTRTAVASLRGTAAAAAAVACVRRPSVAVAAAGRTGRRTTPLHVQRLHAGRRASAAAVVAVVRPAATAAAIFRAKSAATWRMRRQSRR